MTYINDDRKKIFFNKDRDFKKSESLIIKLQKCFTVFSARLASGDVDQFINIQVNVHLQIILSGQRFYCVDFREIALRLKQISENVAEYL